MFPERTSEQVLNRSKDVLLTDGEWELVDVGVDNFLLVLQEGNYSQVKYSVRVSDYSSH